MVDLLVVCTKCGGKIEYDNGELNLSAIRYKICSECGYVEEYW